MLKDDKPSVDDDPETALEKSGSVDERIPEPTAVPTTMIGGAPAAYLPNLGTGLPTGTPEAHSPGEVALEHERTGQRAGVGIQRG